MTTNTTNKTSNQSKQGASVSEHLSEAPAREVVTETKPVSPAERAIVRAAAAIVAETVRGFDRMVSKCQALATADTDAPDVKGTRKADLAKSAGMSPGQYSKLCKVGRASSDERDAYMALAGDLASVKGFYTFLTPPKASDASNEPVEASESPVAADASPAVPLIDVMLGNLANLSREDLSTLSDAIAARLATPVVRSAA